MRAIHLLLCLPLLLLASCETSQAGVVLTLLGNWQNVLVQVGVTTAECPGTASSPGGSASCGADDRLRLKGDLTYEFSEGGVVVDAGTYVEDADTNTLTLTSTMKVDKDGFPIVTVYSYNVSIRLILTGPENGVQATRYYAR